MEEKHSLQIHTSPGWASGSPVRRAGDSSAHSHPDLHRTAFPGGHPLPWAPAPPALQLWPGPPGAWVCLPGRPISGLRLPRCCGCGPPGAGVTDPGVGPVRCPIIVPSPGAGEPRGGMWTPRGLLPEALHPHLQALRAAAQPCLHL